MGKGSQGLTRLCQYQDSPSEGCFQADDLAPIARLCPKPLSSARLLITHRDRHRNKCYRSNNDCRLGRWERDAADGRGGTRSVGSRHDADFDWLKVTSGSFRRRGPAGDKQPRLSPPPCSGPAWHIAGATRP